MTAVGDSSKTSQQSAGRAVTGIGEWRRSERERLIAARLVIPAERRAELAQGIGERLDTLLGESGGRTISLYWPFRGEPDLRGWMVAATARGWRCALPVVMRKAAPLVFRAYAPGDRLGKGVWNIPVPADGESVLPNVVIAPLVGFDAGNYRLGYGGGFFDRTLAAMSTKPLVIGVGYSLQRLETIHPQPHDIPMDRLIIAEA